MSDRAVSITLNYVLGLAIITLLISGLLFAGTEFVDQRRENVIREELTIIGQQIVSEMDRADRLVDAGHEPTQVQLQLDLPSKVAGSSYDIEIRREGSDTKFVTLEPTLTDVRVDVRITNDICIPDSSSSLSTQSDGGDVIIEWADSASCPDGGNGVLVIKDAS